MKEASSVFRTAWNIIGLNIGWFACVLSAAWDVHWLSFLIVLLLAAIHVLLIGKRGFLPAILLGLASLILGLVLDTALITAGAYEPKRWLMPAPITTIWLLMLWVNFSLCLNKSLKWFQEHLFLAAILGSIFGPLAYLAASRLGAIQMATPLFSRLLLICVVWLIAMPLMSLIAKFLYHCPERFRNR